MFINAVQTASTAVAIMAPNHLNIADPGMTDGHLINTD